MVVADIKALTLAGLKEVDRTGSDGQEFFGLFIFSGFFSRHLWAMHTCPVVF